MLPMYRLSSAEARVTPEPKHPGLLRPLCWGASEDELMTPLPGDLLVPRPRFTTTRAVTIEASCEEVWPWLVQMGHGRGGLYSYDWLENLLGFDVHSAQRIQAEHQRLTFGDPVRLVPEGWHGLDTDLMPTNVVASILTAHHLVLQPVIPRTGETPAAFDGSWAFVLVPCGTRRCRLIVRGRTVTRTVWATVQVLLQAPLHMVMERKMLLGIKARAERRARSRQMASPPYSGGLEID